ncbi:hypothetical protein BGX26_003156 [Mortierella sp. AD094]|nr:hypothetical protein BGX26_003156 [Mortierella sp. AD094]
MLYSPDFQLSGARLPIDPIIASTWPYLENLRLGHSNELDSDPALAEADSFVRCRRSWIRTLVLQCAVTLPCNHRRAESLQEQEPDQRHDVRDLSFEPEAPGFKGSQVLGKDAVLIQGDDVYRPWVGTSMRELAFYIELQKAFTAEEQEEKNRVMSLVFEQLSRLTKLENLDLGGYGTTGI